MFMKCFISMATLMVSCMNVVLPTDQTMDAIKLDNESGYVFQSPLEKFWKSREERPRFDFKNTANWKGYEATWEIRDSKLYMTGFTGEIGGKKVTCSDIVHQPSLPLLAKWYSGKLYVSIGKPILGESGTIADAIFPRVVIFEIESGMIKTSEEKKDFKLPKPWHNRKESESLGGRVQSPVKSDKKNE